MTAVNHSEMRMLVVEDEASVLFALEKGTSMITRTLAAVALLMTISTEAFPVCVNRFVKRSEPPRHFVTLLTGKLTFPEAQSMVQKRGSINWTDENGALIATGTEARAVRPMPVACDDKTSGSVLTVTFLSARPPSKKMQIRFDGGQIVEFEEQ